MLALVNSLNVTRNTKTIFDFTTRIALALFSPFESNHKFQDYHSASNGFDARNADLAPRYTHITNYWAQWQKRVLQEVATATAAISVVTVLATSYWFFRMRKRLRHKYVVHHTSLMKTADDEKA